MTDHCTPSTNDLIRRATNGDRDALGRVLEYHRPYLRLLADRSLQGDLKKRIGASDIVQQTSLAAMQAIEDISVEDASQFLAWLRQIHQNQICDAIRQHTLTQKRDLTREEAITGVDAAEPIDIFSSTPSQRVMAAEEAVLLAQAIEQLPPNQREAIRLKYIEGLTLVEAAEVLSTSKFAVVGLLNRGLKKLRQLLRELRDSGV